MWCSSDIPCTVAGDPVLPRLALITALDTDGKIWFALTHANTDSEVMMLFLSGLVMHLDHESANWRENSVVLLDGAKYHTSMETRNTLKTFSIPTVYSAPYSYSTAPIELLFSGLKRGNLNPGKDPLGKK